MRYVVSVRTEIGGIAEISGRNDENGVSIILEMPNPHPSPATRFAAGDGRPRPGRRNNKLLRSMLLEAREDGDSAEKAIIKHLIEMATRWSIIHLGKEYEVASGRDSVEAAKILFQYAWGKPPPSDEESRMQMAEHFRQVAKDAAAIILAAMGSRKETLKPEEIAEFISKVSVNTGAHIESADRAMLEQAPKVPELEAETKMEDPDDGIP